MALEVTFAILLLLGQGEESPCIHGQPTEACENALLTLSLNLEEQLYHEKVDRVRTEKKLLQCMTSSVAPLAPRAIPTPPEEPSLPVWAWLLMIAGGAAVAGATTYVVARD